MWPATASNSARLVAGLTLVLAAAVTTAGEDPHREVRGVILSCHRAGDVWAGDATAAAMTEIVELGGNWVAIHPYAAIADDGTVSMWPSLYEEHTEWLSRPVVEAHRRGLKIAIKPHLAYWGSPFAWRGDITFTGEDQWRRFFTTYERWLVRVLELTAGADAVIVGTELDRTVHRVEDWRRLIATARRLSDAPLTYGANWDTWRAVGFWDALDVIGVQAYFPLVKHDAEPTEAELPAAWHRLARDLAGASRRHNRAVLLTELGYNASVAAARQPWQPGRGDDRGEPVQQRCFDAALATIAAEPAIVGAFLWKWFPEQPERGDFRLTTEAMRRTLRRHWQSLAPAAGLY